MDRLDEIELPARQIDIAPRRRFTAHVGRFAHYQDGKIGIFRRIGRLPESRIALAFGIAARLVTDLNARVFLLQGFEHGHRVCRLTVARPIAVHVVFAVCQRADHGYFFYGFADRQRLVLVLQKNERLLGGRFCLVPVGFFENLALLAALVGKGVIEKAQPEFHAQNVSDRLVDDGHCHLLVLYELLAVLVIKPRNHLHIRSRVERVHRG